MSILPMSVFNNSMSLDSKGKLLEIGSDNIIEITTKLLKMDPDKVMNDIKKREIARFRFDPQGQTTESACQELIQCTEMAQKDQMEFVNIIKEFRIQDIDLLQILQRMQELKDESLSLDCQSIQNLMEQFEKVLNKKTLEQEIADFEFLTSEASLKFLPEYEQRLNVLRLLGYIDPETNTVKLKGRVACEMGSQELIITELVLENVLTERPPAEIAALLSCMVFQQKNCSAPELNERLQSGIDKIKECAKTIGQCQKDCGMKEAVLDYVDQFHFGLTEVVYEWARGMPFAEITQLTDVQEGVIVRTIQRLDETLRDVKDAARVIGDAMLYQKMDEASTIIKRDIVFAASLYTQS